MFISHLRWRQFVGSSGIRLYTDIKNGNVMALCPGQGAQYTGMFAEPMTNNNAEVLMERSVGILGYDIRSIANEKPKHVLDRTVHCQPATVLSSIVAFEKFKEFFFGHEKDNIQAQIGGVAGYSVGEYSALYISGGISFTDVLSLVKVRAESMQSACDIQPTGMLSMQGLSFQQADQLCADVSNSDARTDHYVQVAIYQYPGSVLLAGSASLLDNVINRDHSLLRDESAVKLSKVPVSGAFHTNYMKPAQEIVHNTLQGMNILPNRLPLYSNQTGRLYQDENEIRDFLVRQICEPLKWNAILHEIIGNFNGGHFETIYEIGPGKNLKWMLGKKDRRMIRNTRNISS